MNLSNVPIDHNTHLGLQLGLGFIPTPKPPSPLDLRVDFLRFERTLRIQHFFRDSNLPLRHSSDFIIPSAFTPPAGLNSSLDAFLNATESDVLGERTKPWKDHPPNIPLDLWTALRAIRSRNDIVIKPADKGGAVVVWDKEAYIQEGLRQLQNPDQYRPLDIDPTPRFTKTIVDFLKLCKRKDYIPARTVDYLIPKNPRTAQLYLLPKIHKGKTPTPGRPINSANDSPTEKISQYVDHFLKRISPTIPSYLKDTQDFIIRLRKVPPLPPGSILATVDVTSLYTNIPHAEGIGAAKHYLNTREDKTPHTFVLLKLIHFILTMNVIKFNDNVYLQTQGTAMGTKMAPNYAILFMARLEEAFLNTQNLKPLVWWRYIDDIFIIWTHGVSTFHHFIDNLNNFHPIIKFTTEFSTEGLPFLDTWVYLTEEGLLATRLFTKPTDAHLYLHYKSHHPKKQKDSIPLSQFLRLKRICTLEDDFIAAAREMFKHFQARGYPDHIILKGRKRAMETDREVLLTTKEPIPMESILYIYRFNNPLFNPVCLIQKHLHLLMRHPHTRFLSSKRFQGVPARSSTLRDILVSANSSTITSRPKGNHRCERNCSTCPHMAITTTFTSTSTGKSYKIQGSFSCTSWNVIYLITCKACHLQYVGQTSNTLSTRMNQHLSSIRRCSDTPIAQHFNQPAHNVNDVIVNVVTSPMSKLLVTRLRWELAWIRELVTMVPSGLNTQERQ